MIEATERSPAAVLRPILAGVLALAAAMGIGRFAYTPILPAMMATGHLDTFQAGLLASANYAGYLAGALLAGLAVPAKARGAALRGSAVAVVATTALMAIVTGIGLWVVVRFVSGLASAGVFVLASGLVLGHLRSLGLGARSGWLFSGVGLGIVISGAVVAGTSGALGWRGDWLLLAALAALAIVPCWRWLPVDGPRAVPSPSSGAERGGHHRTALFILFAAYFLEGLGYIVTGTFLVAIVEQTAEMQGIGARVWIVVGLAVIPSSALWTGLAGRTGFVRALIAAYLLQAVGIVAPLLGGSGAALASAVLFGGTFAGISALILTLAGHLSPIQSGALVGLLTATFGIGQVLGPLLAGMVATRLQGFAPALMGAALLVLLGAGLLALLLVRDVPDGRPPAKSA